LNKEDALSEIGPDGTIELNEEQYAKKYKLSDGQIYWRRSQIMFVFKKDKVMFDQEYPTTPGHAWATIGASFIPNNSLSSMMKGLKRPQFAGDIANVVNVVNVVNGLGQAIGVDASPDLQNVATLNPGLVSSKGMELSIFRYPEDGARYFMGGDTSEGKLLEIGKQHKSDKSALIIEDEYGRICATYGCWLKPEKFWLKAVLLGKFYNYARMNIEYNNDGKTLWVLIQKVEYPNHFWPQHNQDHPWTRISAGERIVVMSVGRIAIVEDPGRIPCARLYEEAAALVRESERKIVSSKHDDYYMAYCHCEMNRRDVVDSVIEYIEIATPSFEETFSTNSFGNALFLNGLDPRDYFSFGESA
jgi:hypothetical protein